MAARMVGFVQSIVGRCLRISLAGLCWASLGSAQAATYIADDSPGNATTYPWIDTTSGGTSLNLGDDSLSATINIGFNFTFGTTTQTGLRIDANGMVQFGGSGTTYTTYALPLDGNSGKPNLNMLLMPLWDDLSPGSTVTYKLTGSTPNRRFTVTWTNSPYFCQYNSGSNAGYCDSSNTTYPSNYKATFQVQLHENGTIVYRYGDVHGSGGSHGGTGFINGGATIGLELSDSDYTLYARNSAVTSNGLTIVFTDINQALTSGQRYSFASHDTAGAYMRHATPLGWVSTLSAASSSSDRDDASFTARPGLSNSSCWSFESVNNPGSYLRNSSFRLRIDPYVNTTGYKQDATFCLRAGLALGTALSFESVNYPGYYIRRQADMTLGIGAYDDASFNGRATWSPGTALADQPYLLARYRMDETAYTGAAGELKDTAGHSTGPFNGNAQGSPLASVASTSPARSGSTGTCGYAVLPGPAYGGGNLVVSGLPVSASSGIQSSVAFWMYWDGSPTVATVSLGAYTLGFYNVSFGFNTNNSDLYGTAQTGLSAGWHHVAAVFTNGSVTANQLWIDGVAKTLSQRDGIPNLSSAVLATTLRASGYAPSMLYRFSGRLDELHVYNGPIGSAEVTALYNDTHACAGTGPDHLQIEHDGGALTCTPETVTVKACANTACSSLYTSGAVSGHVAWSGAASGSAAFSIASGQSTTTVSVPVTTVGTVTLATGALSPSPAQASTCLNTSTSASSCALAYADSGLLFDVPHHRAESSQTVTVTAVKKADNSASCTPAFASVSKSLTFQCSYSNPATGTLPVRVGGSALNASNSTGAACDSGGRAVSLSFNASGQASTTVQYADVGSVALNATYTGSGADAGLVMGGSDSFTAAPYDFAVSGITGSKIAAGSNFSATATARNYAGNATPNFGRETVPEGVSLGFVRTQPTGTAAMTGGFTGSAGAFSSGAASLSNLAYTEVGKGNVSAVLASGSYLGTGMALAGSSQGSAVACASENGSCVLPSGATATVYYGVSGRVSVLTGRTGTVACNNTTFGDPAPTLTKSCQYVVTSGVNANASAAAQFKPHHFDVAVTPACGAFSYAGQAFTATVSARNAAGSTTVNYDGSANTSPNFALATVLADAPALAAGSLSGGSVAASAFSAGQASASLSYAFTTKQTAPQTLVLRASDSDGVSSSGYAEGSTALRSGRLRLSNAFGRTNTSLLAPVTAEYWGGSAWVPNSADSCTTLASANLAQSNPRNATGAASAATSTASVGNLSAGRANISLGAPSPAGSSLSLDLALNLGASTTDASCNVSRPTSTGAALPWLRARQGSCALTDDRDPAARASFGIFMPESRRQVDVRNLY